MVIMKFSSRLSRFSDVLANILLVSVLILALFPVFWTFLSAFKAGEDIVAYPPRLLFDPTLDHYRAVLSQDLAVPLMNSVIVTVGSVVLALLVGSPAGYALSRFRSPIFRAAGIVVFAMRFLPTIVFILPVFLLFNSIGLTGTRLGLIIAYQSFCLPLTIWLTWGFFSQIPRELEEAARIDGCTHVGVFVRIMVPLALPGIGAAAVVTTIFSWNQFFIPLILAGRDARVIVTEITRYAGAEDAIAQWGSLAALSSVIVLPVIITGFFLNRYLVRGLLGPRR
jgi:multiple sugar transport system permease protein